MRKTLTEQWREGTLPRGWYYVKDINNEIYIAHQYTYGPSICLYEEEVLAPVPSYDEYKELVRKSEQLEKKLEIATKALEEIAFEIGDLESDYGYHYELAKKALKEMEGVK